MNFTGWINTAEGDRGGILESEIKASSPEDAFIRFLEVFLDKRRPFRHAVGTTMSIQDEIGNMSTKTLDEIYLLRDRLRNHYAP